MQNPFDSPNPNSFMRDEKSTGKNANAARENSEPNPTTGDAVISIDDIGRGGQIHIGNASVRFLFLMRKFNFTTKNMLSITNLQFCFQILTVLSKIICR